MVTRTLINCGEVTICTLEKRVLQCIAVGYGLLRSVAGCCSVWRMGCLRYVCSRDVGFLYKKKPNCCVCCSVLQCVAVCCSVLQCVAAWCSVLQCVAVCCSVLQCGAVCCSVLQCVAVCCSVWHMGWDVYAAEMSGSFSSGSLTKEAYHICDRLIYQNNLTIYWGYSS